MHSGEQTLSPGFRASFRLYHGCPQIVGASSDSSKRSAGKHDSQECSERTPGGILRIYLTLHPPVLFVHSKNDIIVPLFESLKTHRQLQEVNTRTAGFVKHGLVNSDGSAVVGMGSAEELFRSILDNVCNGYNIADSTVDTRGVWVIDRGVRERSYSV